MSDPKRRLSVPTNITIEELQGIRRVVPCSQADIASIENLRQQLVKSGVIKSDVDIDVSNLKHNESLEELAVLFKQISRASETEEVYNADSHDPDAYEALADTEVREFDNDFASKQYLEYDEEEPVE